MDVLEVYRMRMNMSDFAAATKKPTVLYANHIFLRAPLLHIGTNHGLIPIVLSSLVHVARASPSTCDSPFVF